MCVLNSRKLKEHVTYCKKVVFSCSSFEESCSSNKVFVTLYIHAIYIYVNVNFDHRQRLVDSQVR